MVRACASILPLPFSFLFPPRVVYSAKALPTRQEQANPYYSGRAVSQFSGYGAHSEGAPKQDAGWRGTVATGWPNSNGHLAWPPEHGGRGNTRGAFANKGGMMDRTTGA